MAKSNQILMLFDVTCWHGNSLARGNSQQAWSQIHEYLYLAVFKYYFEYLYFKVLK